MPLSRSEENEHHLFESLRWFAYGSHKAGVEALLEAGANPDAIVLDEAGNRITALDIAHKIEAEDVVKVLVNHRAHKFADMSPDEARANAPRTIDLGGEL